MKEARFKRVHTIQFHLYEVQEQREVRLVAANWGGSQQGTFWGDGNTVYLDLV